jgi:hypothetical protein
MICGAVDFTLITPGVEADGTLGPVAVVVTGSEIKVGGVTDGTYTGFSDPTLYSTPLATSDNLFVFGTNAPPSFTVTFGSPIQNPRIYVRSFASTLTVGNNIQLTKISGDPALTVSGSTATGQTNDTPNGYDTNGIIELAGTLTTFTFTLAYPTADGIDMELYGCH